MNPTAHRDIEYFLEPIIFSVNEVLFRLPRDYLVQASGLFLDMLQLPQPAMGNETDSVRETSTDPTPIIELPNVVTSSAFASLIQFLYPNTLFGEAELTKDGWLDVLRLSDMWDMIEIRSKAIASLRPLLEDDPAYMLNLAKKYDIDIWLHQAIEALVRRNSALGDREFGLLDRESFLRIAALRECCYPVFIDSDHHYGSQYSPNTSIGRWEIRPERGEIPLALDDVEFPLPISTPLPNLEEHADPELEGDKKCGEFYFEKIVFKVEDRLFRVSNRPFVQHSAKFRREFERRGFIQYDHRDPFVVKGVAEADFSNLLRFFFPPQKILQDHEPTSEEWASILRLATKWEMTQVKDLAVQKLENLDFGNAARKLEIGKELGVQRWFSAGVMTLITRSSPLTASDLQALQHQELILKVLDFRERAHYRVYLYAYGNYPISHLRSERGELPQNYDISAQVTSILR